jgi:UDP-glucose 4-epimerase
MSFKNVAIIGSNGFIGKHLTEKLLEKSDLNLFLFGKNESSFFKKKLPYVKLNLSNSIEINRYFEKIDIIYYLASDSIPASSWEDPLSEVEKNLMPFINFLKCIAELNVKKIVFVSSAGTIYGSSNQKLKEDSDKKPFSPHGIIKLTMENFLNYFEIKYNLTFDIYRLSNVYGPGQNTSKGLGIINTFIENIISNKRINIFGIGNNIRNYVYIDDVAELLSYSLYTNKNHSTTYNLSSNDTLSITELVSIIKNVIPYDFEVTYGNKRQSDNTQIFLDNTKILQEHPEFYFTSIKEGILKTYLYIKENSK